MVAVYTKHNPPFCVRFVSVCLRYRDSKVGNVHILQCKLHTFGKLNCVHNLLKNVEHGQDVVEAHAERLVSSHGGTPHFFQ